MVTATASSGIRRKVDDLGRVVIPAGMRRSLNIREGDTLEVAVDGERIVLARPRDACVFCGLEGEELLRFRNRLLCADCADSLSALALRASADAPAQPATTMSPEPPVPDPGPGPLPPDPHPPTPAPDPSPPGPGPTPDPQPQPGPSPDPQPGPAPEPDPQPMPTNGAAVPLRRRGDRDSAPPTAW